MVDGSWWCLRGAGPHGSSRTRDAVHCATGIPEWPSARVHRVRQGAAGLGGNERGECGEDSIEHICADAHRQRAGAISSAAIWGSAAGACRLVRADLRTFGNLVDGLLGHARGESLALRASCRRYSTFDLLSRSSEIGTRVACEHVFDGTVLRDGQPGSTP